MNTSHDHSHRPQTLVNREFGDYRRCAALRSLLAIVLLVSLGVPPVAVANTQIGRSVMVASTFSASVKKAAATQAAASKAVAKPASGAKAPKTPAKAGAKTAVAKSVKGAAATKSKTGAIAKGKRERSKKRGVPALLEQPRRMPLQSNVPGAVVSLLEDGEIAPAVRRLYLEPASVKNMMLIREMERIGEAESGVKPARGDEHRHYLNLAIAYHNLHLFLQTHGKKNRKMIGRAQSAYVRAEKAARGAHKFEAEALRAALEASLGNASKAAKLIGKVPLTNLEQDISGVTALASYYAATGDTAKTIELLHKAKAMSRGDQIHVWAQVGDDFAKLREQSAFQDVLVSFAEHTAPARAGKAPTRKTAKKVSRKK